jgi:hypothetical protein
MKRIVMRLLDELGRTWILRFAVCSTLLVSTFLPFGCYVWPTRYHYEHTSWGGNSMLVRIDRLTGETDVLVSNRWLQIGGK